MYALAGDGDGSAWSTKKSHINGICRRLNCLESTLHDCALKGMTIIIRHLMQFLMSQQPRGGGGGRGKKSLELKIHFQPGQILMELEKPQTVSEYSPSRVGAKVVRRNTGLVPNGYNYKTGTRIVCIS